MENNELDALKEFVFEGFVKFTKAIIKKAKTDDVDIKDLICLQEKMNEMVNGFERKSICSDKVEVIKSLIEELQKVISEKRRWINGK